MNYLKKQNYIQILMIILSAFIYSIAMNFFVYQADIFPGGFSGFSRIISQVLIKYFNIKLNFSYIYFTANALCTFWVYKFIGKKFALYSILHFTLVSLFTLIIPKFEMTDDLLLMAIFGGIVGGFSISIALRNNASSGGMDFIAMYMFNKYKISAWDYVMGINVTIVLTAGIFFGWEKSLYSIIYQFCSTQVVSALHNRFKYKTLYIVTEKAEEVGDNILKNIRHGITRLDGSGVYGKKSKTLLIMTVNAFQVDQTIKFVREVDDKAFINVTVTEKVVGNFYQIPLE